MLYTARLPRQSTVFSVWGRLKSAAEPHLHVGLFLVAVVFCGLVFGSVIAGQLQPADTAVLGQTVERLLTAISAHQLASASELWWHRMVGDAQLLALLWLFGVSVIGLPFVVIAIFLRAFSVGFAVGFTVLHFGWKGFVVAAVAIFLHQVLSLTAFVCAGVLAIRFSAGILGRAYPLPALSMAFLKYTAWFLLFAVVLMAGAAIQAYVAPPLLAGALVGA
ncbi:stage II sporulation protein M [Alicyclobacillus contaminans]|uniref:stage II sporulation protein M n=1 Tax=Alicyclobacillus contaminans TaxID=392016 RepID=UPI0003FC7B68|nr:stage II sporulation protein M [Alicyclobacillus contaminans]GMA52456.1 stage II sporulation protein M [Alicyclobacillus contaminans]